MVARFSKSQDGLPPSLGLFSLGGPSGGCEGGPWKQIYPNWTDLGKSLNLWDSLFYRYNIYFFIFLNSNTSCLHPTSYFIFFNGFIHF